MPLGIALLLLVWGSSRGRRCPGLGALAVLWIFSTPLTAELLWRVLEWPYQRRTAASVLQHARPAAIVVLGTGRHPAPGPARASEWVDADRFFAGLEAFAYLTRQDEAVRLIFTGGWWPTQPALPPEGDVLRESAIAFGIPPEAVVSTSKVRNTADEAKAVAAVLPEGSTVLLVTSAFHMPRAQRLFQRQGLRCCLFRWIFRPLEPGRATCGAIRSTSCLRPGVCRAVAVQFGKKSAARCIAPGECTLGGQLICLASS